MAAGRLTAASRPGRHRHARKRAVVVLTSAAGLFAAASISAAAITGGESNPESGDCTAGRRLQVAAAPELVPAVEAIASSSASLVCLRISVTPTRPAQVASALMRGEPTADVWIPDSSRWLAPGSPDSTAGVVMDHIASSPVVLAVTTSTARRLGNARPYERIAEAATTQHPVTLRAPSPGDSATSQAALFDLYTALDVTPTQRGRLAALLRSVDTRATATGGLPVDPRASAGEPTSVAYATTERQVRVANSEAGRRAYRAVRPEASGTSMDYPYVVLTKDPQRRSSAEDLLEALTNVEGRAALAQLGFRTERATTAGRFTRQESRTILTTLAVLNRPSRLLALVDVSGSMEATVPGAGGATRMDLVRTALSRGMTLLPSDTVAGLWRFSASLTPSTDYEQMAPMTPLTPQSRPGVSSAISRLSVNVGGGTGLYSSVLAATRYVRAGYDPERVNSVVVLSDGKDEAATAHGISLRALLEALRADAAPGQSVRVIAIAYGPDSDSGALRRIAAATGGSLYTSTDPRDLPVIFREAIGQRLCGKHCG
jgi:Ca-activated chloride channel homolog